LIETKLFEVRDRATCIPVMATYVCRYKPPSTAAADWLLARAGWGLDQEGVHVTDLYSHMPRFAWGLPGGGIHVSNIKQPDRTYTVAFGYIIDHFTELESGAVVDVRFILGEEPAPAESDRFYEGGIT